LIVLGMVIALACVSAIGAVTTLVVMAMDTPASAEGGDCGVVAWKAGMMHCFRNESSEASKPARHGPAVVAQAQAGPAR
jgi:phage terminase large subunit-like protein